MCVVVTVLIVGVVTLNALLAQAAFQMQATQDRVQALQRETVQLTDEAARRSAPGAVATWARHHDMVTPAPGEVHILRVPGAGR
jgi:Tfp pilus assembly protein PilV